MPVLTEEQKSRLQQNIPIRYPDGREVYGRVFYQFADGERVILLGCGEADTTSKTTNYDQLMPIVDRLVAKIVRKYGSSD